MNLDLIIIISKRQTPYHRVYPISSIMNEQTIIKPRPVTAHHSHLPPSQQPHTQHAYKLSPTKRPCKLNVMQIVDDILDFSWRVEHSCGQTAFMLLSPVLAKLPTLPNLISAEAEFAIFDISSFRPLALVKRYTRIPEKKAPRLRLRLRLRGSVRVIRDSRNTYGWF